ncbi:MAG: hypothetical protein AB1724_10090 [Thermodesulfobacteriota bacterium]
MVKLLRRAALLVLIAALVTAPLAASARQMSDINEVNGGTITADFLVCRPLGLAATILGSALFVVSLPFSALGDNIDQVGNILVVEPARFTFTRPLGKF